VKPWNSKDVQPELGPSTPSNPKYTLIPKSKAQLERMERQRLDFDSKKFYSYLDSICIRFLTCQFRMWSIVSGI
jgi:hypothetical protein